jgi:hypothetical protein
VRGNRKGVGEDMIRTKDKPRWTHWEQRKYALNWEHLVKHEMRRLWERGEMRLDDGLKRWCGILPRHRNGNESL